MKTIEELTAAKTAWYASDNQEVWTHGPYETRDEAELAAFQNELPMVCEATIRPVRLSKVFEAEVFLERADEVYSEMMNEDGDSFFDFTEDAVADLQNSVRAAIDEWQVRHQLSPEPFMFEWASDGEQAAWTEPFGG